MNGWTEKLSSNSMENLLLPGVLWMKTYMVHPQDSGALALFFTEKIYSINMN